MQNKIFRKTVIFSIIYLTLSGVCFAQETSVKTIILNNDKSTSIKQLETKSINISGSEINVNLSSTSNDKSTVVNLGDEDSFLNVTNAVDKFVQRNIRASKEDFKSIIESISQNDFYYLILAKKSAELGFYELADFAFSKVADKNFIELTQHDIKAFYYPKNKLSDEDELFLAQIYSDITFNNQSSEAVEELQKNKNVSDLDYANYLAALGYYKSNNSKDAIKYINNAINMNSQNINYQFLKAKIYADNKKSDEAIKTVNNIKHYTDINSYTLKNKINALESYVFYKTKKSLGEKNYYLAKYYYIENDYSKALKALQAAASDKRNSQKDKIYGLMSEIYFIMQDCNKALETAQKARKYDKNEYRALITLGDLSFKLKQYDKALEYYKKAANANKKEDIAFIKTAKTLYELNNIQKSKLMYDKILKTFPYSWKAYYELALITQNTKEKNEYLQKSLRINPLYANSWAELAHIETENNNFQQAQQYLTSAGYIDENNFKYYYYQGILYKKTGELSKAKYNLKKALKINANNPCALRELDSILKIEEQDML